MAATWYESVACDGERFIFPKEFSYKYNLPYNPCVGMSPEEMSRYIQFLFEQIQQKDAQHKDLLEQLAGI